MTWLAMGLMDMSRNTQKQEQADRQRREREALRLVRLGQSVAEVAERTGLHRLAIERGLREAIDRQTVIRQHLQSRSGLTSLVRYSDRGPWGQAGYMGNCPGFLIVDLLDYFQPKSVFDPMEGSGTTGEVCEDFQIAYEGRDLRSGFDVLSSDLPDRYFDLVFWHPPYWPGFRYSDHPNDFSTAHHHGRLSRSAPYWVDPITDSPHSRWSSRAADRRWPEERGVLSHPCRRDSVAGAVS